MNLSDADPLPWVINVAYRRVGSPCDIAACDIAAFQYRDEQMARDMFAEYAADPATISCTLCDGADIVVEDYEAGLAAEK